MIEVFGQNYYVDFDKIESYIDTIGDESLNLSGGTEMKINVVKYELIKLMLDVIFSEIESNDFNNVFLMCDNEHDTNKFKERYGNKIITYDEFTSKDTNVPFFKMQNSVQDIHKHIEELVFGVYTLSKTKHFICTKSNISSFSILSNSELNFKLLNT